MYAQIEIQVECKCGTRIIHKESYSNWHNSLMFTKGDTEVFCEQCGMKHIINVYGATSVKTEAHSMCGKVYKKDNKKFVVRQSDINAILNNKDVYEFVCDTPHSDGDFSYLCTSEYCRCSD